MKEKLIALIFLFTTTHVCVFAQNQNPKLNSVDEEKKEEEQKEEEKKPLEVSEETMEDLVKQNPKAKKIILEKNENEEAIDTVSNINIGSSDEAALIIFAVVGLAIVIMWVPYFPIFAYKVMNKESGYNLHHYLAFSTTSFAERDMTFNGAKYGLYIKKNNDTMNLGINAEAGRFSYLNNNDTYLLIGPSIMFANRSRGVNYGHGIIRLDLLVGDTFSEDTGLVSKGDITMGWKWVDGIYAALRVGGIYTDVKEERGLLTDNRNLGLNIGGEIGLAF